MRPTNISALLHYLITILLVALSCSCSAGPFRDDFPYFISAANYGHDGVMILKPSLVNSAGKATNKWHGVNPGIPTVSDDFRLFTFTGFQKSLPRHVEVVWQLAELNECTDIVQVRSAKIKDQITGRGYPNPKSYVRKSGCNWSPIKRKIFHTTLDMAAIRNSRAYKRTGKPVNGSYLYGTYTLNIKFLFKEGHLTVKAANGQTQGFGQ